MSRKRNPLLARIVTVCPVCEHPQGKAIPAPTMVQSLNYQQAVAVSDFETDIPNEPVYYVTCERHTLSDVFAQAKRTGRTA